MKFQKGQSGNPGGRPKSTYDVQALAREMTPDAMLALSAALADPKTRVAAAIAILDRGYGKPLQTVQSETTVRYVARMPEKAPSTEKWQQQHAPTLQ